MEACHITLFIVLLIQVLDVFVERRRTRWLKQQADALDTRPEWNWTCPECGSTYSVAAKEVEVVAHAADAFIAFHAQLGHKVS